MNRSPHTDPILAAQIDVLEARFRQHFADMDAVRNLVEAGLRFQNSSNVENKAKLFDAGFFSEELLVALISGGQPYRVEPISFIMQRLVESEIALRTLGHMPGAFVDHRLERFRLLEHLCDDTFRNIFAAPSGLILRYGAAVVAIDVRKSSGDCYRASGFIVRFPNNDAGRDYVVTCKHNVDPNEGITLTGITAATGLSVAAGPMIISPNHDIAVARVSSVIGGPVFRFGLAPGTFDEVYTLGYPSIPGAQSMLLGHRGEVNGIADMYLDKAPLVIISNLVSPGSSGGPVLSRGGHCVGMSVRWLEGDWEGQKARFSAAIPASTLAAFLSKI